MYPYRSHEHRVNYQNLRNERALLRRKAAEDMRHCRAVLRGMVKGPDILKYCEKSTRWILWNVPKPGSKREYAEAWATVRLYETHGAALPNICGADDHAWERAMWRYNEALAVVTEHGRPLP